MGILIRINHPPHPPHPHLPHQPHQHRVIFKIQMLLVQPVLGSIILISTRPHSLCLRLIIPTCMVILHQCISPCITPPSILALIVPEIGILLLHTPSLELRTYQVPQVLHKLVVERQQLMLNKRKVVMLPRLRLRQGYCQPMYNSICKPRRRQGWRKLWVWPPHILPSLHRAYILHHSHQDIELKQVCVLYKIFLSNKIS